MPTEEQNIGAKIGADTVIFTDIADKYCSVRHSMDNHPTVDIFYRHSHLNYELLYFVRGDAEYNIEGQIFALHPHDVIFIPPKSFHYLHLHSSVAYERYCFNFDGRILPGDGHMRLDNLPSVMNIKDHPILRGCFEKTDEYVSRFAEADARLMMRCTLREILLNMLYETPEENESNVRHNHIIDRIIALTDAHPEKDWNAETLSRELFLSKSYIQNTFSQYMDIGLKNYINTKKILYAQSLLLAGDRPADVCEACGFRDYSTFYRLFRKITGKTPTEIGKGM